ncbi:MAG: hypothetical protein LBB59_00020 [Campylobacteraceae bacterium]|jgi:hypothetical protein|nr:hypothetical protein [Campylobacteraceae bacterium]
MIITITNADDSFITILKEINKKIKKPYEFLREDEPIDKDEILKEMEEIKSRSKTGTLKTYKNMEEYRKVTGF